MAILNIKNLPDGLYERLEARAEQQHRSVAQEVTHILDQVLGGAEPLSILDLQGLGKSVWSGVDAAAHVDAERHAWDGRRRLVRASWPWTLPCSFTSSRNTRAFSPPCARCSRERTRERSRS